MEQVLILLVMLAGTTHAFFTPAVTKCNATQNASLCSATVGGSVYIQMMTNSSGYQMHCKKEFTVPTKVFSLKKEKVTIEEAFRNRTEFFISNGTFKITSAEKNDSGQYTAQVFDQNGVSVNTIHVKLEVQENYLPIWILVSSVVALILITLMVIVLMVIVWRCCRNNKKGGHKKPAN